ncbi:BCCT family transporter [Kocuria sp. UBA1838]|uniref:BCCT family transporter n=1 Tax=Kocuria sp. UBA1838 TaxID=1946673 RepID=UPI0025801FF6|nr:BCCT family transporter [Kocuria sp. UBA1838]
MPVNWRVFVAAATLLVSLSAWATEAPEHADAVIGGVVAWVASRLGWFYILTAALAIVFVILVADSRHGTIKMGPDHAKPQFNLFTGWAMYALMGMAFGYFAYRFGMPLSIRSALYPLIGCRIHGAAGDAVDTAALLGTILGVDKGIRRLSELNIILAIGLMLYVLITGRTAFLLDAIVKGVSGLRVADASVMPELVTVNPNITVFMSGERAAELIAQDRDTTAH